MTELTEIESGIKNKFKWNWFSEKDGNGDYFSEEICQGHSDSLESMKYIKAIKNMLYMAKKVIVKHSEGTVAQS